MSGIRIEFDASQVNRFAAQLEAVGGAAGALASAAVKKTAYAVERDGKAFCAVDTGATRNSISTTVTGDGRFREVVAEIGPTTDYAPYLEFGTSRMAPHAFMGPAFDRHAHELQTALAAIVTKTLGKP